MKKLFLLFIFFSLALQGAAITLQNDNEYPVGHTISYWEDPEGNTSIREVVHSTVFAPYTQEKNINFGFTQSVYWFKIDLHNPNIAHNQWWLKIDYPLLEYVDFYVFNSDGKLLKYQKMGTSQPFNSREVASHHFISKLPLNNSVESTLLLRVKTQSSLQLPFSILSSKDLIREIEQNNFFVGIYYGLFFIILLYNIVLYVYSSDRNYLRYLFFLVTLILWQLSFDGIGVKYVWTDCTWLIEHGAPFWIALSAYSALYFSRNFLHTLQYAPKMDIVIRVMMLISFIMAVASLMLSYSSVIKINAALGSLVPLILLVAGIIVLRHNYRPARFYIAGWSSLLIGTTIFAFNKFDLIPSFYGVNHMQQIGSAIEMIFLSWALGDRVHLLQREYIDKINHLNETLSEKVASSLAEVRKKDELFVQQSRFAALGEMIEQIAHQWRQPLNTLSLINQNIYFKRQLGECDEAYLDESHELFQEHLHYMSKTIDDFRNYYKMDKHKEAEDMAEVATIALRLSGVLLNDSKIKGRIENRTTAKAILAKNEMIQVFMNLIKNAHDVILERQVDKGEIVITIFDSEGFLNIWVEDNGGGVDGSVIDKIFTIYFTTKLVNHGTGLGLHMCRYIIEESFGGTIQVENTHRGARFSIKLPIDKGGEQL